MISAPSQAGPQGADDHPNLVLGDDLGWSLKARLESRPLASAEAVKVGMGVLSGLRALHRAGLGHGALDTANVQIAPNGQARLTGSAGASFEPAADLVAAGRVLCAMLGADPHPIWGRPAGRLERAQPGLVAAARAIAAGDAGASASSALMIFGDAAGRLGPGLRVQRSIAGLEMLAIGAPTTIAAAVDRVLRPAPPEPRPAARPRRMLPIALVGAGVLALVCLSALPALNGTTVRPAVRPASASVLNTGPAPALAKAALPAPAILATALPAASPDAVVVHFYTLAAAHRFAEALALWDENLRTNLPPAQYPDQRFAHTTSLVVNRVAVTGEDGGVATVATDLTEVTGGTSSRWVGSWRLVNRNGVWLLDQPDFQAA